MAQPLCLRPAGLVSLALMMRLVLLLTVLLQDALQSESLSGLCCLHLSAAAVALGCSVQLVQNLGSVFVGDQSNTVHDLVLERLAAILPCRECMRGDCI